MHGRSYASPVSALSPWGSHFYPALSVSSAAKWAQEESRLWEDRQASIKEANRWSAEVDLAHTQCPSRLCRICPLPLLRLSAFTLAFCPAGRQIPMAHCGGRQSIWFHFTGRVVKV